MNVVNGSRYLYTSRQAMKGIDLLSGMGAVQMKTTLGKGNGLEMNVSSYFEIRAVFKFTYHSDFPVNKPHLQNNVPN